MKGKRSGGGMLYVLIYFMLMFFTAVFYFVKKKSIDIFGLLIIVWTIASGCSVYIYINIPYYAFNEITVTPYLYLYALFMIGAYPFMTFDVKRIKSIRSNYKLMYVLSVFIIGLSVLPLIENSIYFIKTFSLSDSSVYSEVYVAKSNEEDVRVWLSMPGRIMNTVCILLYLCAPIILFYWLIQKRMRWLLIIGLMLSIVNISVYSLLAATRVAMLSQILYMIYLYLLFRQLLNKRVEKYIRITALVVLSGFVLLFMMLSLSRFNNTFAGISEYSVFGWFAVYGGESSLRFNAQMWNIKAYMNGDNGFSFFKQLLGFGSFSDLYDMRYYWTKYTYIDQQVFYTYIGDIYGDFGPLICVIMIAMVSVTVSVKNKDNYQLYELIPMTIWYYVCSFGFLYYPFATNFSNKILLSTVVFYYIVKIFSVKHVKGVDNLEIKMIYYCLGSIDGGVVNICMNGCC
ncbi:MAG: oligosaccharide repeat unit polymerase [Bacteroidetes bacterium]|nr:oligosaccharide repeat unit polymerase [Bacteroidota bacterium]